MYISVFPTHDTGNRIIKSIVRVKRLYPKIVCNILEVWGSTQKATSGVLKLWSRATCLLSNWLLKVVNQRLWRSTDLYFIKGFFFSLKYGSYTQVELLTCYSHIWVTRNEFPTKCRNSLFEIFIYNYLENIYFTSCFVFFLKIQLMVFGIFLCLDAFLYVFTLLPLRVFLALFRLFTLPCYGLRWV